MDRILNFIQKKSSVCLVLFLSAILGLVFALFFRLERLSGHFNTQHLTARSIQLVDSEGVQRGLFQGGGEGSPALFILGDKKNNPLFQIIVHGDGRSHLALMDSNGRERLVLDILADGRAFFQTDHLERVGPVDLNNSPSPSP